MTKMDLLLGSVRRLGRNGPPYQVLARAPTAPDGSQQMRIHMIESDEDLDYATADILRDPLDD